MILAQVAFVRLVAIGLAWIAGTAVNAATHASTGAVGYWLFAIAFMAMAVATWKLARR